MMNLVFVGTGVSCAIPVIGHLNNGDSCACKEATEHPEGPNKRNNVSLLIQLPKNGDTKAEDGEHEREDKFNILIDCGKTFRDAYFRVLAPRGVRYVDALLLTHGHADAMQCVEELCDLHTETHKLLQASTVHCDQSDDNNEVSANNDGKCSRDNGKGEEQSGEEASTAPLTPSLQFIPTYLTTPTLQEVKDISPHVVAASKHCGPVAENKQQYHECLSSLSAVSLREANSEEEGKVAPASLAIFIVPEEKPVPLYINAIHKESAKAASIPFYSLPVEHGANYISLGFVFGSGTVFKTETEATNEEARSRRVKELEQQSCIVYISDVSSIIPASLMFLESLVKIDVLVLDLLAEKGRTSPPHTCWDDCMPILRALTPRKTYFVGMFCSLLHAPSNRLWKEDMEEERERMQRAVAAAALESQSGTMDAAKRKEIALLERFLDEVETAELAYDGLELVVPL